MKIAIVNNRVPFIYGGAEFLADSLRDKLIEHGHEAIVIKIPFQWNPPDKILDSMLACRLLKLENTDRVIALKFPAYYIEHPNKVLWLLHQFRQAYDLWGTEYQCLPSNAEGIRIRECIINSDNHSLTKVKKIYTISRVVSDRLKRFNDIESEVIYHPLMDSSIFYCKQYGDYFFYPSRISRGKRQHLVIESMKYTKSAVKLIVAGSPDVKEDLELIESIVKSNHLESKVKIISKFITEEDKANLFANALGCTYIPYDEDSYGYVTLEAYHSKKPVITCSDSGGTDVVVIDGVTGFIVEPEPKALAEAMDNLYEDKKMAERMGRSGLDHILSLNITWNNVIERLTK